MLHTKSVWPLKHYQNALAFVFSASPLSYMLLREGPRLRFDFVMKVWPKGWGDFLCGQYFWRVENAVLTSCRWLTYPCLGLVQPELAGNCPRPGVSLFLKKKNRYTCCSTKMCIYTCTFTKCVWVRPTVSVASLLLHPLLCRLVGWGGWTSFTLFS